MALHPEMYTADDLAKFAANTRATSMPSEMGSPDPSEETATERLSQNGSSTYSSHRNHTDDGTHYTGYLRARSRSGSRSVEPIPRQSRQRAACFTRPASRLSTYLPHRRSPAPPPIIRRATTNLPACFCARTRASYRSLPPQQQRPRRNPKRMRDRLRRRRPEHG